MKKKSTFIRAFVLMALVAALPSARAQTNLTLLTSFTGNIFGELSAKLPACGLLLGSDGAFYGTSVGGGISNNGTVFKLNRDGSNLKILKSFLSVDGRLPSAGLIEGIDGALYGTTFFGGISNNGTIFKLNKDGGNFMVLHHFQSGADGYLPQSVLVQGTNGAFYGTTSSGGVSNSGVLFKVNSDGSSYQILHPFSGTNASFPMGKLLDSDGVLYGTTEIGGGTTGAGTVFKIDENGNGFTLLHVFRTDTGEGTSPGAGLLEGTDHVLYGSTISGGINDRGTVFKLNKDGNGYATLVSFDNNNTNGGPLSPWELIEGDDGFLYGASPSGGITNRGTCFKLDKNGNVLTILRKFTGAGGDGNSPQGPLLKGSNGVFYGTTRQGGDFGYGCAFALSTEPLPSRILSLSISENSNVVQVAGTSAFAYDLQRSTNLVSWTVLDTLTASFTGRFSATDSNPPPAAAFYRFKLH